MRDVALEVATWLFSRLVPGDSREALIGDLTEEYAWRRSTDSSSSARKWYVRQIFASVPHLLWLRLRRPGWLATLGVALLAYVTVGVVQVFIYWAIPSSAAPVYNPIGLVIVFPLVLLIAYVAEQFRRGAAVLLGGAMLLAMIAMTVWISESAPLWYRIAYFVVGPAAAFTGAALRSFPAARS